MNAGIRPSVTHARTFVSLRYFELQSTLWLFQSATGHALLQYYEESDKDATMSRREGLGQQT